MKSPKKNQIVLVYDRYRFAIPLRAVVAKHATGNDGVEVQLLESNNSVYPIGSTVWVSKRQLRLSKERQMLIHPGEQHADCTSCKPCQGY